MLQLFPFVAYLALATSATLLAVLWISGDIGQRQGVLLSSWLALAAYYQLFSSSTMAVVIGLGLQTVLALYLILYWKLHA